MPLRTNARIFQISWISTMAKDDGFWGQFTIAQLNRELGDWRRELKDSTNTSEVQEAKKTIAEIEREIASRR